MKTGKYTLLLIFVTMVTLVSGFKLFTGDDPFIATLKESVDSYFKNKPWEKVYLHIDKPFYKPGEDIWFKVYLTDGTTLLPSKNSDVVYVELINPKGNTETTLTLQSIHGTCFGSFSLSPSVAGGIYKIKAYTRWMHNFGDNYFFEKEIQVQKIVYPRLLTKLDFEKKSYGPGDSVKVEVKIETLENVPLSFREVTSDVSLNGKAYLSGKEQTDKNGKATVVFALPAELSGNDGLVNLKVRYEGSVEAISRSIPIVLNKVSLQFFPESGYLIEGVPCRVAFKALNEFGKPADIQGYIQDDRMVNITGFQSFHDGMGAFTFVPGPGRRYYAIMKQPVAAGPVELPAALKKGYTFNVQREDRENYVVQVYSPLPQTLHLAIQAGKLVVFSKSFEAVQGRNEVRFSAARFPVGIGMVTLFDASEIPRCERLVFFNHHKRLHVSLQFDKDKYQPREKVSLHIKTLDEDSIPVSANLSLSVVNDQMYSFADDKQHNILSWLLVGSELKGKIEEPDFYFNPEEPKAEQALDYLLMTQGWRRYDWDDVLKMNYNVVYRAERIGCISGCITSRKTGVPLKAEVTIMELQDRYRILTVKTGTDGKFKFLDADASATLQILARADNANPSDISIELDQLNFAAGKDNPSADGQNNIIPEIIKVQAMDIRGKNNNKAGLLAIPENELQERGANEMVMKEDMTKLEEVVVVGYGVQMKKNLTGAVAIVNENDFMQNNIQNAMQGKVAGMRVIPSNGEPGTSRITLRGVSSLTQQSPLLVIDGVVYDPGISGSFLLQDMVKQDDITSLTVFQGPGAVALYGSKGAGGAIVIDTRHRTGNFLTLKKIVKPKYTGLLVTPRKLSVTKEFYYPVYEKEEIPETRSDFRSTVYWNPDINTNAAGDATVSFCTSDEITTFRAVAEGIGSNGCVGRSEKKYVARLPFSMAVKFPAYLSFGDTVKMPLIVKNSTTAAIKGSLDIQLPECLTPIGEIPASLVLDPDSAITLSVPFFVKSIAGKATIRVAFKSEKYNDAFSQEIDVQPKGFPTFVSVSGKDKEKQFSFVIGKSVPGSFKASFTAFPDLLSDLMSGVESILREPYGCFEQTSSSTYPNIMVLQYLKETETKNKEVMDKASGLIKRGYERLTGFETSEKGYEWFGHAPAHEGLTAYGIMEFTDMKAVYPVDNKMMERTITWILDKRDGKGNFSRSNLALDQFGRASDAVNNAYIVYALSEAGIEGIEKEYAKALDEALTSADPYRLSLLANAAFNLKKNSNGLFLLEKLEQQLLNKSWDEIKIDHSITRSYGKSLYVETASLYVLAQLKSPQPVWSEISRTVNYLVTSRSYGGFGSTQATILALKALTEYARAAKQTSASGKIGIRINGHEAANYRYEKGAKGKISLDGLEAWLLEGENKVEIRFDETDAPLPFSFDAGWNSITPASSADCKVSLSTGLSTSATKVGETVRLTAKICNRTNEGLPMAIALIGIPSGLSLQPWQLKEMTEQGKMDFYEVSKNYLVVYYRQMKPGETRELHFDLKAEIKGSYVAPASSAYLYYTNEFKNWRDGEVIRIE